MRTAAALLLVVAACGRTGPDNPLDENDAGDHDLVDGGEAHSDGSNDASDPHSDAGANGVDGGPSDAQPAIDAAPSIYPMTELGTVSCWSVGGFQAVYHDQPAHIVVTLTDNDGIADIETTAEVTIIGHYGALYDVGPRPLLSLGNTGCCTTSVKVPIYYDDFVASAQAVGTDGFFSAYATFKDHGGSTVVARCDHEWFLHDGYYGN